MIALSNSFSINMLVGMAANVLRFVPLTVEEAKQVIDAWGGVDSYVGHPDTARLIEAMLGLDNIYDRQRRNFAFKDGLLVAQYTGPRLPEGATCLPKGAAVNFWLVLEDYHQD